ncbi:MAG: glutathione S-transferase [Actinomycetota bacterium]|nr:glutathione S-transferase [Actinomycetota bacterium]
MSASKPVLWHIPISHYNEKVRWALDWKGIAFERHAPTPGAHMAVALWLTRGVHKTFPILQIDGRTIGDSSAIIASLEQLEPDPPLYPSDPAELDRALELERFFDEELGPHVRLLAFHELRRDPEALAVFAATLMPAPMARSGVARALGARMGSAYSQLRYRVGGEDAAQLARKKVLAALDRLERELEAADGHYLIGDALSVADLTAASMFMPLAQPPEGPNQLDLPEPYERFREPLRERPGYRWVLETFARDRRRSPQREPALPAT